MVTPVKFSQEDIEYINSIRAEDGAIPVCPAKLVAECDIILKEMNIEDVLLMPIRDKKGRIVFGGARVPLIARLKDEHPEYGKQFVIKSYDHEDKKKEIKILKKVNGVMAPKIYHLGENCYAEEFVDLNLYTNLINMADKGPKELEEAVKIGVKMHARLAKMEIVYAHNHWLDEFNISKQRDVITDFGTAQFFAKRLSGRFKEIEEVIINDGMIRAIEEYNILPCSKDMSNYKTLQNKVVSISEDRKLMINIFWLFQDMLTGIKTYAEHIPGRVQFGYANHPVSDEWKSGWTTVKEMFPLILDSFIEEYKK